MRNRTLTAAIVVAGATALTATAAAAQDWYVQGDVGANFQSQINGRPSPKGDTGWMVSGAAGREFGPGFRGEAEVLYLDSDGKHSGAGDLKTVAGMLNGYYDFARDSAWQPYVGAGIGVANAKVDGGRSDGDDTGFAYQFKVGVSHPFNDRLTGDLGYRYLGVNGLEFGHGLGRVDGDYTAQAVTVGLRYKLGL